MKKPRRKARVGLKTLQTLMVDHAPQVKAE
jgi:hypothetical protein